MTVIVPRQGEVEPRSAGSVAPASNPKVKAPPRPPRAVANGSLVVFSPIAGVTSPLAMKAPIYFQCPPTDEFPVDYSWSWDDYTTIDFGEPRRGRHGGAMHSNPEAAQLASYSFNTLLVDPTVEGYVSFAVAPNPDPFTIITRLRALGDSMSPFRMQAGNPRVWGAWEALGKDGRQAVAVTLRALRIREAGGEPGTRYLTVTLTEFADAPAGPAIAAPTPKVLSTSSRVDVPKGKTLYDLAKENYGQPSAWRLIAKASGLSDVNPSTDLSTLGARKPPVKIVVPARPVRQGVPR